MTSVHCQRALHRATIATAALTIAAAMGACGGKAIVDPPIESGSGGATTTSTSSSTPSSTFSVSTVTTSTSSSMSTTSSMLCFGCQSWALGDTDYDELCADSQVLADALTDCLCVGSCVATCTDNVCVGDGISADCSTCATNACAMELNACFSNP